MDAAAKKWIQQYKKLFDQVAARNAGMNVVEDVTTVERKEQIKKIGKLVDEPGGTATQVPKKVIKKIGKIVPEESAEGTPSTASGPPPSRGRLGAESNKKNASGTKVQDSGERDAVALNENNVPFVVVGDDILDGVSEKDWIKTIKDNLLQKYPDGITLKNNTVVIDRQSRKELTFSKYMQWLKKNNPDAFSDKLRATNNADEILLAATDWISEGLNHPRKDNIVDFAKGNVLIRVGANDYSATVIVGTRKNGTMLLYDIINLQKTTIKQKKTVEAEPVNPSRGVERKTSTIFNNSISQKSQNSNSSDKNSSKDFNSGERSALADGKRATAGEVAAVKSSISKRGIDPKGIIAIADKYFARYSGQLTRTGVRYEFLAAADMLFDLTAESGDRAYASVEALAEELVTNEKDTSGMTEDIKEMKRHIREITFDVREWA